MTAENDTDTDVATAATGGYRLRLAGTAEYRLAPGSRTALVGPGADALLADLAAQAAAERTAAEQTAAERTAAERTGAEQTAAEPTGVALILGDSQAPLHGAHRVGDQIAAALGGTRRAAWDRAIDLLEEAGVPEPHERVGARPHELSPLDRQRAQLALALANRPALLLAEDPAEGLSQAEVPAFAAALTRLHSRLGFTLVLSTPVRARATRLVDEILVLEDGRITDRLRRRPPAAQASVSSSSSSST
jgi:ABC-type glutathione transport system ATPase component